MTTSTAANKATVEEQIAAIQQQLAEQKGENERLHATIEQMQASAAHQAGDKIKVMGLAPGSPRTREQVKAFLAKEPPKTVFFCDPPGTKLANAIHPKKNFDPKTGQAERVAGVDLEFRDYKGEGAEILESRDGLLRPKLRWGVCDIATIAHVVPDDVEPVLGEYTQSQVIEAVQRSQSFKAGLIFTAAKAHALIALEYERLFIDQDRLRLSQEREAVAAPGEIKLGRAVA